jgi:hypothetical protein
MLSAIAQDPNSLNRRIEVVISSAQSVSLSFSPIGLLKPSAVVRRKPNPGADSKLTAASHCGCGLVLGGKEVVVRQ